MVISAWFSRKLMSVSGSSSTYSESGINPILFRYFGVEDANAMSSPMASRHVTRSKSPLKVEIILLPTFPRFEEGSGQFFSLGSDFNGVRHP